jgi:hypothetical protein
MTIVNKRAILQPMLDKIELGWVIAKPDPLNPCDIATKCIFQHRVGYREVNIAIGNDLFQLGKLDDIENLVRPAIQAAERTGPLY